MLHASRFWTVDNSGNSIHIDTPVSACPFNNTVCPKDGTSSPSWDVQQVQYHNVLLFVVTVADHSLKHTASLDTEPSDLAPYILIL